MIEMETYHELTDSVINSIAKDALTVGYQELYWDPDMLQRIYNQYTLLNWHERRCGFSPEKSAMIAVYQIFAAGYRAGKRAERRRNKRNRS